MELEVFTTALLEPRQIGAKKVIFKRPDAMLFQTFFAIVLELSIQGLAGAPQG